MMIAAGFLSAAITAVPGRSPTNEIIARTTPAEITISFGLTTSPSPVFSRDQAFWVESIGGRAAKALAVDAKDSLPFSVDLSSLSCACPHESRVHPFKLNAVLAGQEHGDGFSLHQQLGPAQVGLNAGRRGQRIETLFFVKRGALFIECFVVAIDVAQIACRAHDIGPRRCFAHRMG